MTDTQVLDMFIATLTTADWDTLANHFLADDPEPDPREQETDLTR